MKEKGNCGCEICGWEIWETVTRMIGGYGSIVKGIDSQVSFRLFLCGDASAMSFVEESESVWLQ